MKQVFLLSILILCGLSINAEAVTCRSGVAASKGSQTGYDIDKNAATQTSQSDRTASDTLGKCVGGITAVITAPQFPSMSAIFDQIKNKICQAASDQINNALYSVNSQLYQAYGSVNSTLYNSQVAGIIGSNNMPSAGGGTIQQSSSSSDSFWSNFWK